jgi:hypothetical protein
MGHVAENRLVAAALHDRLRARGGAVELLMPRGIAAAELPPYHPVAQVRLVALKRWEEGVGLEVWGPAAIRPQPHLTRERRPGSVGSLTPCGSAACRQTARGRPALRPTLRLQLNGGPLVRLDLADGSSLRTRLVVGADGRGSRVRQWAQVG